MTSQTKTDKYAVQAARMAPGTRMMRTALTLLVALLAWPVGLYAYSEGDWDFDYDEDGCVILTEYKGSATEVTTPETLGGYPVVEIGYQCFKDKWGISKVTITSGVIKVGTRAFAGCISLTSISFPITILEIGGNAFFKCTALTSVTLPERLIRIADGLFAECTKLEIVTIPNSVTSIGETAFSNCSSLKNITIPNSITQIEYYAFYLSGLENLFYAGTKTQWEEVTKNLHAFDRTSATIHWLCTATFDMQGVGTAPESQTVYSGVANALTIPTPAPSAQGYIFGGWYTSDACTEEYDFTASLDDNVTIYAKWTPLENTITFDTGGKGTTPDSQTLLSGETVTEPEVQFVGEEGHEEGIEGWYTDADRTQAYDFSTPVDHTMTLYAKWVAAGHATINVTNAEGGTCTLTDAKGRTFADGLIIPGIHTLTVEPLSGHAFSGSYTMIERRNAATISSTTIAGSSPKTYSIDLTENDVDVSVSFTTQHILSVDIATDGTATAGTYTINDNMGHEFHHNSVLEYVADEASVWDPRYDLVLTISKADHVGCAVTIVNNGRTTIHTEDVKTYTITPYGSVDIELFFYDKTTGVLTLLDDDSALPDGSQNADLISAADGKRRMVTLSGRTLYRDGGWNTICLPFDVKIEGSPLDKTGVEARTLSEASIEGNTLTLTFGDPVTTLEAGKPYIIKWKKPGSYDQNSGNYDIANPLFSSVTLKNILLPVKQTAIDFTGSFSPVIINGEDRTKLYLGADNTLYYPNADMTINAFRAIFQLKNGYTMGDPDSNINSIVLNFGDDATSIVDADLKSASQESGILNPLQQTWFTLDGRRLNGKPTAKGIYIYNGYKIVIK